MVVIKKGNAAVSLLQDVRPEEAFWCRDGRLLKNLEGLRDALLEMSEETFRHHVRRDNNDFTNWVRDVIGDATLARELRKAATRATAARRVDERLRVLRSRS